MFPVNTILMAMYGDGKTKGQVGFLRFEATTNQACCGMICNTIEQATYLFYHLFVNRDEIVSIAIGGAQENLSKAIVEDLNVLFPPKELFSKLPFTTFLTHTEALTRITKQLVVLKDLLHSKMIMGGA
jgi:type I restriction enzyme S subunit